MCFDHMKDLQIFCEINLRGGGDQTFVYFADLHCKLFVLGQCFLNIQIDFKAIYRTRNEHLNGFYSNFASLSFNHCITVIIQN